jgi:hypothetical protein
MNNFLPRMGSELRICQFFLSLYRRDFGDNQFEGVFYSIDTRGLYCKTLWICNGEIL